ncbi:DUF1446 domain-containing protein [Seongchinamella unica]|uniref:DUF1446 domain-containing protein n=1 Tax=Seongchinamella unica TaxID=2547392 RepID=A0A4V2ZWZ7_9GAMM|nr:acyclic terpene utilization AtuA family protein [Seongchinamella unica]TDG12423.1 DUF1446 domain-containing protein [Seongchinamella unica]
MTDNSPRVLRIANAQGFWGDSQLGPLRLVQEGPVDYLTFDYLAELSLSIMQKQKMRDPQAGYARDFIQVLENILPTCQQKGIRIIANAAGVNPAACRDAILQTVQRLGLNGIKVGVVSGDDILDELDALIASGEAFANLESGETIDAVRQRITSANVYIGALPIVEALEQGADIVVTGRVADPSMVLAPLIHEFGWPMDDYDKLAAGTIMGHLVECGPQCTGGNFTDWRRVPDMAGIGFPVVEASADGSFVVTKHDGTGGLVDIHTVTSQLLYELGDPENYLSPDCIADFTSIRIEQAGENRVKLSGIRGRAPTPTFKVSMSYADGYRVLATLCVAGPDAVDKAQTLAEMVFERLAVLGSPIPEESRFLELFGTHVLYRGIVPTAEAPHEILMRIGARGRDRKALSLLGTEIAPLLTSGPPGLTGFAGGRARPSEVVGYWPALVSREKIPTRVTVEEI